MCGIAGFVGGGGRADLERMAGRLAHRGPDAEGFHILEDRGIHLAHRRLSIIDLEGGAQPMVSADGRTVVVFNGEIYNHAVLRRELQERGCVFETDHSDTEVLLHGWREWGEGLLDRMNGMWAFAILEVESGRLFLSRDRFGKKPLYWFWRSGVFGFASELRALMEHPACPRGESETARVKFLAHALIPAPHSAIDGVWKLPAGHSLVFDGRPPVAKRWWRLVLDPVESRDERELADELRSLLEAAVARRMVADVPVGVFLSGGLDSSTVAALAARGGGTLRTYTIGFEEESFDESGHAAEVARFLGAGHRVDLLGIEEALSAMPAIFDLLDEPQGDGSLLPTWLLCRFARREVTVALSGDGGDELFAGYDPFKALRAAEWYRRIVPAPVHEALRVLAGMMPVSHANMSIDFKIKRTLRGVGRPAALWNPVWLGALESGELERATGSTLGVEEIYSEAIEAWESCGQDDVVSRTLQFYTEIYLQDGILAKADRASMMNSLEVRSPFLDIEVADFARRLPNRFKLRGGTTKYLLKEALRGVLPESIVRRRKKGFGMPFGAWLRSGRIVPRGADGFLREKLDAHVAGKVDERLYLWCETVWREWAARVAG
jgi:asparagine synthase (glutamine-hydrolysing)